jgi:hypothetical protein
MQVPAECKKDNELKHGVGVTVYHMVQNIEEVSFGLYSQEARKIPW